MTAASPHHPPSVRASSRARRTAAALLVAALAAAPALLAVAPAQAAPGDVTGGSATWGIDADHRTSFAGSLTQLSGGVTQAQSGGPFTFPVDASASSWDGTSGTIRLAGTVNLGYLNSQPGTSVGNYVYVQDPVITISGTTGTITAVTAGSSHNQLDELPTAPLQSRQIATIDLSAAPAVSGDGSTTTWTDAPVAITSAGADVIAGFVDGRSFVRRATGSPLDPITITLQREAAPPAAATTTTLTASPSGSAAEGDEVTFTATVSPAADGTVTFSDGGTPLAAPVRVEAGTAVLRTSTLALGDHSVTAEFAPADPAAYRASASEAVSYRVEERSAPADVPTTTQLSVAPAAPVTLGTTTTLTATVAADSGTPTGTVSFTDVRAGGGTAPLGEAPVAADGTVTLPVQLSAGGHTFSARYVPTGSFAESSATTTANYGVVDASQPALCTPGPDARTATGASVDWDYSAYSSGWDKYASGDVSVDGETFHLTGGTVVADATCATVSFTGSLRVEAYAAFLPPHGAWVELVDPALTIAADGSGAWTAGVRSGSNSYTGQEPAPRVAVATVSGAHVPDLATAGSSTIALDYAGTTAPGTWSGAFTDAWSNGFVLAVTPSIRAFYYQSKSVDTDPIQAQKAPSALAFAWQAAPEQPQPGGGSQPGTPAIALSASSVAQGQDLTITGIDLPAGAAVAATVHSDPVDLGTRTAGADGSVAFVWTVPADFAPGQHTVELAYDGGTVAAPFTVTAAAAPAEQQACVAQTVSGATLSWGLKESFRTYITGGIANGTISGSGVAVSDSGFRWSGGSGSYNPAETRGVVSFAGSVHFTGHDGALDLTVANPRVRITSPSSAVLVVDVHSKALSGPDVDAKGVTFATLALSSGSARTSGGTVSFSSVPATLTASGATAFAGFYSAGEVLDPVTVTLPLGAETECDATTSGELASTGATLPALWLPAALLALGAGLVVLRRVRRPAAR